MSTERFKELISDLGRVVGLDDLAPDEMGYCCFQFDEKMLVHVQYGKEDDSITLFGPVGTVDVDYELATYRMLLRANMLWMETEDATLSLQPEERTVYLARKFPACVESAPFQEALIKFVNVMEAWRQKLEAIGTDPEAEGGREMTLDAVGEGVGGGEGSGNGLLTRV